MVFLTPTTNAQLIMSEEDTDASVYGSRDIGCWLSANRISNRIENIVDVHPNMLPVSRSCFVKFKLKRS
jgi:hypothetical protein